MMYYNDYSYEQYIGHKRLNRLLSKREQKQDKYVVYTDKDNIIYFIRGDDERKKQGKHIDNFRVDWIYKTQKGWQKESLLDRDYFWYLKLLGFKYGNENIYNEFNVFSLKMISDTESLIKEAIRLDNIYPYSKFFWIIMGLVMYAEDIRKQEFNKEKFVYLKRNVKRLAAYNILIDNYNVNKTVHLTRGMPWKGIRRLLIKRDTYVNLENYQTPLWDNIYDAIVYR